MGASSDAVPGGNLEGGGGRRADLLAGKHDVLLRLLVIARWRSICKRSSRFTSRYGFRAAIW